MKTEQEDKADLWFRRATILSNELAFILGGLRNGTIKSKPIINMDPEATEIIPVSLEEHIEEKLKEAGFTVKAEQP